MDRPIGLIGIGLMGTAIAERLCRKSFKLLAWDINALQRDAVQQLGGSVAKDATQVFDDCQFVLLSLPTNDIVRHVLDVASVQLRSDHIIIDTSTGDPQAAVELARSLRMRGIEYLDATISGSSAQVRDASAVALVGASENGLEACSEILRALTSRLIHVGSPGSGSQMKLVTNLVLGLNRAALAEGLAFAQASELPLDRTLEVLRASMAYSRIMDTKGEKMISRDFAPQAKLSQHAKDVRLILNQATSCQLRLPLSETHLSLLQQAIQMGLGDVDNCAILDVYCQQSDAKDAKA